MSLYLEPWSSSIPVGVMLQLGAFYGA